MTGRCQRSGRLALIPAADQRHTSKCAGGGERFAGTKIPPQQPGGL